MKREILNLEKAILSFPLLRLAVRGLGIILFRLKWFWARVKFGSQVRYRGLGCVFAFDAEIKYPNNLRLGNGVIIGSGVTIGAHGGVTLGNDVRLSKDVMIETAGLDFSSLEPPYTHISQSITLHEGVWVGSRAIILGGVTIGKHSVVAAGSVVTKSMPEKSIIGGIPARVIRTLGD